MVAYNFHHRHAGSVWKGEKGQTIRKSCRVKPGDKMELYTGQRTKACHLLGRAICKSVDQVYMTRSYLVIDGVRRSKAEELDAFARTDGFENWPDMLDFFAKYHGFPFHGYLIKWRNFKPNKRRPL